MNSEVSGSADVLGDSLLRLTTGCKGEKPGDYSLRRLALANLRQLADGQWEKVVAAAFRAARTSGIGQSVHSQITPAPSTSIS